MVALAEDIDKVEELRGLLAVGVLPEILRRIFLERRTGILHLAYGVERSDVEFSGGYLTNAETTIPGAHLGDLLVQVGFLSSRDRDACLEIAALSHERMGETLLRHGLLDADHLTQGLALQLREVMAKTLTWKGGVYTFTDQEVKKVAPLDPSAEPRLDPREVLLDATWTLVSDPGIDGVLGDLTQKVRKARDERLLYLDFRLAPADAFLLTRVDGALTGEQLLELSPLPRDEAKASLAGLLSVGAVEYIGAPPPSTMTTEIARFEVARLAARITSSDPFEVLGLTPGVASNELRSTYLRLLRSCDPATTTDPELKPILLHMSGKLAEAFKEIERRSGTPRPTGLKRPAVPPPPPAPPLAAKTSATRRKTGPVRGSARTPAPAPPPPEPAPASHQKIDPSQAVEAAAQAFDAGRLHEALAILHEAVPHLEGRARRVARVRKAKILLAAENGAKLAEEELKTAIAEDPGNADAHAALGGIYHERGSQALAMMEYRKALELQPRNVEAREALARLLAPPVPVAPEGSVLKRFFGR